MRLDRAETIAGQPIKRVRDWLRGLRNDCRESAIAKHFPLEEPEEFIGARWPCRLFLIASPPAAE
jgi:hypothetical protein